MTLNIDPSCTAAPADRESLSDGASQKVTGYALPHAGTPVARQAGASVADFLAWMLLAVIVASAIFGGYYVLNKDNREQHGSSEHRPARQGGQAPPGHEWVRQCHNCGATSRRRDSEQHGRRDDGHAVSQLGWRGDCRWIGHPVRDYLPGCPQQQLHPSARQPLPDGSVRQHDQLPNHRQC